MTPLAQKVMDRAIYKGENTLVDLSVHYTKMLPIIRELLSLVESQREALEKCSSADPLVGYAFDANHQHESLIKEMSLRRKCASEALTHTGAVLRNLGDE